MQGEQHPARLAVTEAREQILVQLSEAFAKDELGLDEFEARGVALSDRGRERALSSRQRVPALPPKREEEP